LVDCEEAASEWLAICEDEIDGACQVGDVYCWQTVVAFFDDWKSCELGMEADPGSSEELVEDIVLLSISIDEAGPNNMNTQSWVVLGK